MPDQIKLISIPGAAADSIANTVGVILRAHGVLPATSESTVTVTTVRAPDTLTVSVVLVAMTKPEGDKPTP